jgi:hypothetical protein
MPLETYLSSSFLKLWHQTSHYGGRVDFWSGHDSGFIQSRVVKGIYSTLQEKRKYQHGHCVKHFDLVNHCQLVIWNSHSDMLQNVGILCFISEWSDNCGIMKSGKWIQFVCRPTVILFYLMNGTGCRITQSLLLKMSILRSTGVLLTNYTYNCFNLYLWSLETLKYTMTSASACSSLQYVLFMSVQHRQISVIMTKCLFIMDNWHVVLYIAFY